MRSTTQYDSVIHNLTENNVRLQNWSRVDQVLRCGENTDRFIASDVTILTVTYRGLSEELC